MEPKTMASNGPRLWIGSSQSGMLALYLQNDAVLAAVRDGNAVRLNSGPVCELNPQSMCPLNDSERCDKSTISHEKAGASSDWLAFFVQSLDEGSRRPSTIVNFGRSGR